MMGIIVYIILPMSLVFGTFFAFLPYMLAYGKKRKLKKQQQREFELEKQRIAELERRKAEQRKRVEQAEIKRRRIECDKLTDEINSLRRELELVRHLQNVQTGYNGTTQQIDPLKSNDTKIIEAAIESEKAARSLDKRIKQLEEQRTRLLERL